jgi:inner membrane protein
MGGRGYSLALLALAAAVRRWRAAWGGLAVGVLLHFVRDVATGPGLPLLWPLPLYRVLLPYQTYPLVVTAMSAWAVRVATLAGPGRCSPARGTSGRSRRSPRATRSWVPSREI